MGGRESGVGSRESGVGSRESGIGGSRKELTGGFEGGFYRGSLGKVVVLFFGDEDVFTAAGFEFFGDKRAQEAGAAGQHDAF